MNSNRMKNQVMAVFGVFMTVFYIGIGLYFALNKNFYYVQKEVRYIFGFTLFLYGIYRGFRTFIQIREAFFDKNEEEEE